MGTRCVIKIKGQTSQLDIYHHYDGYPESVGKQLQKALAAGLRDRAKAKAEGKHCRFDFAEVVKAILAIDGGYKLTDGIHSDAEYLYIVDLNENTLVGQHGYYHDLGCSSLAFVIKRIINLIPTTEGESK